MMILQMSIGTLTNRIENLNIKNELELYGTYFNLFDDFFGSRDTSDPMMQEKD